MQPRHNNVYDIIYNIRITSHIIVFYTGDIQLWECLRLRTACILLFTAVVLIVEFYSVVTIAAAVRNEGSCSTQREFAKAGEIRNFVERCKGGTYIPVEGGGICGHGLARKSSSVYTKYTKKTAQNV